MPAVSDSSPLIVFDRIGALSLLHQLFGEVLIPPAVEREIRASTRPIADVAWISVRAVRQPVERMSARNALGPGGLEAIAPSAQLENSIPLLLDDRAARRLARERGAHVVGSAGVLVLAKQRGILASVRVFLQRLQEADFYLGDAVRHQVLALAGETPQDKQAATPDR